MADRYEVRAQPRGDFGVYDFALRDFCTLDGHTVMGWTSARGADEWLLRCYRKWGVVPQRTEQPPPASTWGTRSLGWIPGRSPWESYVTPIDGS